MPLSRRFLQMKSRLKSLRSHMLPKNFSPTGNYSELKLDRARGYRLLVHAEIESYLEDRVKDTVIDSISNWKHKKTPSITLMSFLANYHSSWKDGDDVNNEIIIQLAKNRAKSGATVDKIIDFAQKQFVQRIKDNHGIREANLRVMLNPVGIDLGDLDATWVTNMDSFGQARGEIAHTSSLRATRTIDPQDELNKVNALLIGLETLDQKIDLLS